MSKKLLVILSLLIVTSTTATTRKVLFIGNSYIYTNNLPSVLQQIATSMGDTLIYDENTPGGHTLEAHSTNATTINKIYSQQWDIVVIQEQSQRPAFSPSQVASDTYPYARKLDSMVRNNKSCTETMFFMTWGYKNGDASNCVFYPPICTYDGMQQRLRESYLQMAQNNNAITSPVGAAWKQVRDSFPSIDLYSPDNSHPSISGTYLAACVFYASIFHKNPILSSFNNGLNVTDAANLKRIAGKIVLDSFSKWNQYGNYTYANFNKSVSGQIATFTNTSVYSTNNYWTFGNGNTSTTQSPSHTYATNGKYQVTLTASNTCFSETKKDSITIGATNIIHLNRHTDAIKAYNTEDRKIAICNTHAVNSYTVVLSDITGKIISNFLAKPGTTNAFVITPGIYIYTSYYQNNKVDVQKVVIY